jgi:hypothetical protein
MDNGALVVLPRRTLGRQAARRRRRGGASITVVICLIILALIFAGMLLAMRTARLLPDSHLNADGRDVIKLGMALIATLVALVLGLMVATAKGTFDAQGANVRQLAANLLLIDRILAEYGPEAAPPRALLRQAADKTQANLWPTDGSAPGSLAPDEARPEMQAFVAQVTSLAPLSEERDFLKRRALQATTDLANARLQLFVQGNSGLPPAFVFIVLFWLIILFGGYGIIAPCNATVVTVLLACSLAVAAALFLILELADPFSGLIRVPDEPLRQALSQMGQ